MAKMGGITLIAYWIHHNFLWIYTRRHPETMDELEIKLEETLKDPQLIIRRFSFEKKSIISLNSSELMHY